MIIALDYDGTFTEFDEFPNLGTPSPDCINTLLEMIDKGHKIVLNTMRYGIKLNDAVRFIESYGIKLYGINNTPGQSKFTKSPKVYADVYIDDHSIGVPKLDNGSLDWKSIREDLLSLGF